MCSYTDEMFHPHMLTDTFSSLLPLDDNKMHQQMWKGNNSSQVISKHGERLWVLISAVEPRLNKEKTGSNLQVWNLEVQPQSSRSFQINKNFLISIATEFQ